jgi:hypothetical protein
VTNITFLAGSAAAPARLGAPEVARDTSANAVGSQGGTQLASSSVPAPAVSPQAGFAFGPSPAPSDVRGPARADATASTDDARKSGTQATPPPSGAPGAFAFNPQDAGRVTSAEPQRSPLLNPWVWLGLAVVCAALALAMQRRLRSSI